MAQDTAQIRKVQDKEGTQFFPITHVDAVIDENGDTVSTLLAGKQATLVSGTNIKTINSQSLLGSGNIVIEGGGGGGSIDSIVMNGDAVTVTGGVADLGTVITQHQDISGKADKVSNSTNGNFAGLDANGNLTDSGHKHSDYQAALVSGTNIKTVNSTSLLGSGNVSVGTYSKPSGGIPKTDLASAVQTSLGKADTALQSYTETDPVFTASAAAGIASTDISAWNAKLSGVTFNGVSATVTGGVAAITATIPAAPGTLQTNLTTAQTASASEALSGSIKLHKIAKTGTYSDLIGTPTIPTKVSELTNDAGYTTNTGTVTRVDVGTSQYSPTSGIVSLPAYPTTLPASDVSAWAKAANKPSYTLDEVSDGSTRKLADYLPRTGGTIQSASNYAKLRFATDADYAYIQAGTGSANNGKLFVSGNNATEGTDLLLKFSNIYATASNYTVYHSGNSNLSTVPWSCSTLTASDYVTGPTLTASNGYITQNRTTGISLSNIDAIANSSNAWNSSTTYSLLLHNANNALSFIVDGVTNARAAMIQSGHYANNFAHALGTLALNPLGGDVGIGTPTPAYKLDVKGSAAATELNFLHPDTPTNTRGRISYKNGDYGYAIYLDATYNQATASAQKIVLVANGAGVQVVGNLTSTGTITPGSASDARLKTNIQSLSTDAAKHIVMGLNPVTFTWNDKATELYDQYKGDDLGFVAQEIEGVLPVAIGTIFEKYKRLDQTKFIAPLVAVAKDHETRIARMEKRITGLEKENVEFKEEVLRDDNEIDDVKDSPHPNYNTIIKGLIEEVKSLKAEIEELKKQIK